MCGGGGGSSNEEAKQQAKERHDENLALQKEQMAEQKRQFQISREDNQKRYDEQKRIANAPPPPAPEKTAQVASPALKELQIGDRKKFVQHATKQTRKNRTAGLGIVS